jgi:peptidylprolyl isomerase
MKHNAIACAGCILMVFAVLIATGCTDPQDPAPVPEDAQASASIGDTVRVHYRGTLDNGSVFDSSWDREPLLFTLGAGSMIPDFEDAIIGMSLGEEKTFTILAENAYGPSTLELDRDRIGMQEELQVGEILRMVTGQGRVLEITVLEIGEQTVTVQNTHPLAGENLTFSVQLVEIVDES